MKRVVHRTIQQTKQIIAISLGVALDRLLLVASSLGGYNLIGSGYKLILFVVVLVRVVTTIAVCRVRWVGLVMYQWLVYAINMV